MDLDYKHTIWSFFSLFLLNTIRLGDYVSRFVFSPIPFLSNIPSATGPLFETLLHPTLQTREGLCVGCESKDHSDNKCHRNPAN
jgi:hypothetical protein